MIILEILATIIAMAFKSIIGVPLLLILIFFLPYYFIISSSFMKKIAAKSGARNKKERKKFMDKFWSVGGIVYFLLIMNIPIVFLTGGRVEQSIANQFGTEVKAVMYEKTSSGIMLNYRPAYRCHFVFPLPDGTYAKASMLDIDMNRLITSGERVTIKYLPYSMKIYPVISIVE